MENARIVVFEDSDQMQELVQRAAQLFEHEIVATAQSLPESLRVIKEGDFDVAIVDGNLAGNSLDCSEGKRLVAELRAKKQGAIIVWFSSFYAAEAGVEPDYDVGKDVFAIFDVMDKF